jgi:hypothetical protein
MSTAAPPAAGKTSFGGLSDQDRIFQNIYGVHDISIKVQQIYQILLPEAEQQQHASIGKLMLLMVILCTFCVGSQRATCSISSRACRQQCSMLGRGTLMSSAVCCWWHLSFTLGWRSLGRT